MNCPHCKSYDLYQDFDGRALMISSDRPPLRCGYCGVGIDPRIYGVPPYDDLANAYCATCGTVTFARMMRSLLGAARAPGLALAMPTKCYYCKTITVLYYGVLMRLCFGCSAKGGTVDGLCATCNNTPHAQWPTRTTCDASTHELSNDGKKWNHHCLNVAYYTDSEDESDETMGNPPP